MTALDGKLLPKTAPHIPAARLHYHEEVFHWKGEVASGTTAFYSDQAEHLTGVGQRSCQLLHPPVWYYEEDGDWGKGEISVQRLGFNHSLLEGRQFQIICCGCCQQSFPPPVISLAPSESTNCPVSWASFEKNSAEIKSQDDFSTQADTWKLILEEASMQRRGYGLLRREERRIPGWTTTAAVRVKSPSGLNTDNIKKCG